MNAYENKQLLDGTSLACQYHKLPDDVQERLRPAMRRAVNRIVARAIRRGFRSLRGSKTPWSRAWRRWAAAWLAGRQRSGEESARVAGWPESQEAGSAAWAAESAAAGSDEWVGKAWSEYWAARAVDEAARYGPSSEPLWQAHDIQREIIWPNAEGEVK